ncbi:hypothetical protein GCM10011391_21970 [Pullulanibacillus camelliae]|uniref:LysM domain-containing protein n=1 Tax=Pullulanibacillus camelliae TaxID=1707096 RepID=A0A8J3DVY8_9BACL|nr:LysM domain-containing protein [Pullulanibacillus camelliae]GGE42759.1 hypothetical protein GCM10011391_21970 [Pullulanibacillus camelliae]
MKIYIVQLGDSLYKIAQKHGVSLEDLKKINTQLTDPDNIKPGMKIKVPSGSKYVKKKVKADKIIKEAPKKEMPKKEMPKKEMPVKENVMKENPINQIPVKENPVNEHPVKENIPEKKPVMEVKKKEPVKKKIKAPIKKKIKSEKKPIAKEKAVENIEENQLPMKDSKIIAPTQPMDNEPVKSMKTKEEHTLPMMEDPYPNVMTPKKSDSPTHDGKWQFPDPGMGVPSYQSSSGSTVYEQGHHPYFHQQPFNNPQSGKMKTLNQDPQPYYPFADGASDPQQSQQQGMGSGGYGYPGMPPVQSQQQGMMPGGYGYPGMQPTQHPQQGMMPGYSYPGAQSQPQQFQPGMPQGGYGYPSMQPMHPQQGMMPGGYGYPSTQPDMMSGSHQEMGTQGAGMMPGAEGQPSQEAIPASQPSSQMPPMGGGQIPGGYGYPPMGQSGQSSTLQTPPGLTELPHRDENPYTLWESHHNTINLPDFPKNEEDEK